MGKTSRTKKLSHDALANLAAEAAEDMKAEDIKLIDVRKITPMTDYLLLCTASSGPHIRGIASHIEEKLRARGEKSIKLVGKADSNWMILDVGKIVIHIMGEVEREKYNLEELWEKKAIIYHL